MTAEDMSLVLHLNQMPIEQITNMFIPNYARKLIGNWKEKISSNGYVRAVLCGNTLLLSIKGKSALFSTSSQDQIHLPSKSFPPTLMHTKLTSQIFWHNDDAVGMHILLVC